MSGKLSLNGNLRLCFVNQIFDTLFIVAITEG